MQFNKLRLHGFKSFVENTELVIESGMTGIIGPNGCGKSNLVEALRWVMGENSPKKMRGSEMDDVIFGGTATRPARNLAEVSLELDNSQRTATSEFNNSDELLVSRKITRGEGSDYRINGKASRQRDVQLLFADQATGAHSTSIVSQGQVGAIVNAKPEDRRQILEEAAGITGLHSRRHEAELRLRAAENNLTRLEDILRAQDGQLAALQRQAKQANRYRGLSDQIRRAESGLLHLRWQESISAEETALAAFATAERLVGDLMLVVSRGTTERVEAAAGLPELRNSETAAAAMVQRLVIQREQLDDEARRVAYATEQQQNRIVQAEQDQAREQQLLADAQAAMARLTDEDTHIRQEQEAEGEALPAAQADLLQATQEVADRESVSANATSALAEAEAQLRSFERQANDLSNRLNQLRTRLHERQTQRQHLLADMVASGVVAEAEAAVFTAEQNTESAKTQHSAAEAARAAAEMARDAARIDFQNSDSQQRKLRAESDALQELLQQTESSLAPLMDAVQVQPGSEAAFAAALGDALSAPIDANGQEGSAIFWHVLPAYDVPPALPQGAIALSSFIEAPAALARSLSQIGVIDNSADGFALAAQLKPGQILVTREGAAFRWDGLTIKAGAPTPAAVRLKQRNRLQQCLAELDNASSAASAAQNTLSAAEATLASAIEAERQARKAEQNAFSDLDTQRRILARLAEQAAAHNSRIASLDEQITQFTADAEKLEAEQAELALQQAALPAIDALRTATAQAREALHAARQLQMDKQNIASRLAEAAGRRTQRLQAIDTELQNWQQRQTGATARLADLTSRFDELTHELQRLQARPANIQAEKNAVLSQLQEAEAKRRAASDALQLAENTLATVERALRQNEEALTSAREDRVRAEGAVATAQEHIRNITARILERLEVAPEQALSLSGFDNAEELPPAEKLQRDFERLLKERDNMGPVNLLAEQEATELEGQMTLMSSERDDLTAAIAKLRHGISELNGEAKERLQASFDIVNGHFKRLFTELFGGGEAYLQLTNPEDPLETGLEIYASPPGKKLSVLTLLSGGEKALTATALLFAAFLTNPSPICVLDEVDAPLDEANVERFCNVVEALAAEGKTRFLIITHHRLTMARMDRLFGVTMGERGVSQLVSVDLEQAEQIVEQVVAA